MEPSAFMAALDLQRCFHMLPLHPELVRRGWLAYNLEGQTWFAQRVLFGLRPGPAVACCLTGEAARVLQARGIRCAVYVDDYLIYAHSKTQCAEHLSLALSILRWLGWGISEDKVELPTQTLIQRGIRIDSANRTLSLPPSKLLTLSRALTELLDQHRHKAPTVAVLRTLLGRLDWACTVLLQGRIHTSRIRALLPPYRARSQVRVPLSNDAVSAISWWLQTLQSSLSDKKVWSTAWFTPSRSDMVRIFSDASGEIGFSGVCDRFGVIGWWNQAPSQRQESSSKAELFPMLCMLIHLLPTLRPGSLVIFTTDNLADCFSINKAYSNADTLPILSYLLDLSARMQVHILCDWAPRDLLTVCDLLSKATLITSGNNASGHPSVIVDKVVQDA